jgi:hypothetical protein
MADKKWGSTVLGWFIVQDDKQPGAEDVTYDESTYVEEPSAEGAPAIDATQVFQSTPPSAPGGVVDFDGVFSAAGVDEEERARVKRAADLLKSLPAGTDPTVKKQIVQASLTAFGVPIESIIEAAVEEIQALEGYIRTGASDTQKVAEEADARIRKAEEEIRTLRQVVQQRVEEQQKVTRTCNDKKLEIQSILEFFGQEAVARVVKESPKLVDPSNASA